MPSRHRPYRLFRAINVLLASAWVFALACPESGVAQAATGKMHLDIPAQDLSSALTQFGRETGTEIVFTPESVRDKKAVAIKGEFERDQALQMLLKGTELTYRTTVGGAIVVEAARTTAGNPFEDERSAAQEMRLAQAGMTSGADASNSEQQTTPNNGQKEEEVQLEEIVVTGSRLKRQGDLGPAPVTVFDREQITRLGVTNVADVLDYLPQQSFAVQEGGDSHGSRVVRLRGLGLGSTLMLINGRRTSTSALQGSRNYFDPNTVPLAAVERIEVLSDSASAVYGADAIGGVVNIILKRNVPAPTVDLYLGTAEGGGDERRASFAFGQDRERVRFSLTMDAFERDSLRGSERALTANQDYSRFGSIDWRASFSNPGTVLAAIDDELDGVGAPFAAIPAGSSGVGLTPADFLATAFEFNRDSLLRFVDLIPETTRLGGTAFIDFDLTPRTRAFGEVLYADSEVRFQFPPVADALVVPPSNPFNPFDEPVLVLYLFSGIGPQTAISQADTLRAVAGLEGTIGRWDWEASVLRFDERASSWDTRPIDPAALATALDSDDAAQAFNPFQDGPGGSPALLASLVGVPVKDEFTSRANQGVGFVRGPLFTLPSGEVEMVAGAEVRSEELSIENNVVGSNFSPDRNTWAMYSEARVPLIARTLALTVAGRFDSYDDFGDTFNTQYGVEWKPLEDLSLRASYGTSFRPPSLYELYQPPLTFESPVFDPRRNEDTLVTVALGGNPDLEPEEADSWSLGFAWSTGPDDAFRLQANYWRIEQIHRVQALNDFLLLLNEDRFPDRIIRDPPTPADIAAGLPGRLVGIDSSSVNFGSVETSGIDAQLSSAWQTRFARITPSLAATWVDEYLAADLPDTPAFNRVGVANFDGTIPRLRATASVGLSRGAFSIAVTGRYTSAYDDADTANVRNGREIPASTLCDLQASFDFREFAHRSSWLEGLMLRLGVINVFDEAPHFSESSTGGFDRSQTDIRQRFGYFSMSKTFQ